VKELPSGPERASAVHVDDRTDIAAECVSWAGPTRVEYRSNVRGCPDLDTMKVGGTPPSTGARDDVVCETRYPGAMRRCLRTLVAITACSCAPMPPATGPSQTRLAVAPSSSAARAPAPVDDGPDPGDDPAKLTERGWARRLRGAHEDALADFRKVVTKQKAAYPRDESIVGPGVEYNFEVALGSALGVLGTDYGLLVFRVATGEPVAWRSHGRSLGRMFSLRGDADLLVRGSDAEDLDVMELPSLRTRASYHLGDAWFGAALSDDHALLAYYAAGPKPGVRLVDVAASSERWVANPCAEGEDVLDLRFAPDAASLAVFTAAIGTRGPHYQALALLQTTDGHALFTTSIEVDNSVDGRIGAAQSAPPSRFVGGGAALDFLDPRSGKTKRVDTRTGRARPSPVRLTWEDREPTPRSRLVPAALEARVCHASGYLLPAEACR